MCDSSSITELSRYRALPGGCCVGPPGPRGPTGQNPYINNTQYFSADGTVSLYGGNNIIISGTTTAINLPANPNNISILYNCFKTIAGPITIIGNGHFINASLSTFPFSGGPIYAYCTIIFDTVANIWIIHNN